MQLKGLKEAAVEPLKTQLLPVYLNLKNEFTLRRRNTMEQAESPSTIEAFRLKAETLYKMAERCKAGDPEKAMLRDAADEVYC